MKLPKVGVRSMTLLALGSLVGACSEEETKPEEQVPACLVAQACPAEDTWCPQEITLANETGMQSVEVRGDFRGHDSWSRGYPMTLDAESNMWKVTLDLPSYKEVEYKFVVKNAEGAESWRPDPGLKVKATCDASVAKCLPQALAKTSDTECGEPQAKGDFDWRDAYIYFAFVDRFANGSTANDGSPLITDSKEKPGDYLGGDYAGITQKINAGYFTDLGVNVLWLSVPFDNPEWLSPINPDVGVSDPGAHAYSGYHGYWPFDQWPETETATVKKVEEHFGTLQELKDLVSAAHAKGIKIVLDYAMVHVYEGSPLYLAHKAALDADGLPVMDANKVILDANGEPAWFWPDVALNDDMTPILDGEGKPQVCHCGQGPCGWDGDSKNPKIGQRCFFQGYLPHWNYTVPAALNYSLDAAIRLAKETEVDGFRLDAVKHIDEAWYKGLRTRLNSEFPNKRFYLVGETYDFGNLDNLKRFIDPQTMLDGQFDFPLRQTLAATVLARGLKDQKNTMQDLEAFLRRNDNYYGCNAVMSSWIGNHDVGRPIHMAENTPLWGEYADAKDRAWVDMPTQPGTAEPYERLGAAFAVLLTNPGAPLLYYGDEYGLAGAGDPDNRRMLFGTTAEVSANSHQKALYEQVKKLGTLRRDHAALRRGKRTTLQVTRDLWVYSMTYDTETLIVAVNRSDAALTTCALGSGEYDELMTGTVVNGLDASVPARQVRIFAKK